MQLLHVAQSRRHQLCCPLSSLWHCFLGVASVARTWAAAMSNTCWAVCADAGAPTAAGGMAARVSCALRGPFAVARRLAPLLEVPCVAPAVNLASPWSPGGGGGGPHAAATCKAAEDPVARSVLWAK